MLPQDSVISIPRQRSPACSTTQPLAPDTAYAAIELPDAVIVRRASIVLVVATEFGVQGFLLLGFTGVRRCCLHQSAIAFSPLRSRLAIVFTCTVNPPFRLRAQRCLNPRKSKLSGCFPCFFAFPAAWRPNSISRVFSGCRVRPYFSNRF